MTEYFGRNPPGMCGLQPGPPAKGNNIPDGLYTEFAVTGQLVPTKQENYQEYSHQEQACILRNAQ
jgi:hypothetical protein